MKKNKMARYILITLAVILILCGIFLPRLLTSSSYDNIHISEISLDGTTFSARVDTVESAPAFKGYDHAIDGANLYLTIKTGLLGGGRCSDGFQAAVSTAFRACLLG